MGGPKDAFDIVGGVTGFGFSNRLVQLIKLLRRDVAGGHGGGDVIGSAQTGTGKTAAFTLPMLHRLQENAPEAVKGKARPVRALVLAPTRELAAQVEESVKSYGKHLKLKSAVIVLTAVDAGKVQIAAGVTADNVGKVKAGELANFVAQQVGGKGGGKPDMAMAGGTDASALPQAMASVQAWVTERL